MKPTRRSLTLIAVLLLQAGTRPVLGEVQATMSEKLLFAFDSAGSAGPWFPVNDTVMGGVSTGTCRVTDAGTLEFAGEVSLENNGGFASLRAGTDSLDLSAYDEWVLRVRGDGKRYAFSVQTDYQIMAGAYYLDFQTEKEQWQEVRAPMRLLEARAFGQPLRGAPPLNARDIRSLGFIISDKQAGPFRLEVDWIKAAKREGRDARPGQPAERDTAQMAAALIRQAVARGVPLFNAGQPDACAAVYELTARCMVDLAAADLPAEVLELLRAGLAKAERAANPGARAWALRDAFDASLLILGRDSGAAEPSDE